MLHQKWKVTSSSYTILNGKEVINCVDFHDRYLKHDEFYYGMYEELKNATNDGKNKFSPNIWQEKYS